MPDNNNNSEINATGEGLLPATATPVASEELLTAAISDARKKISERDFESSLRVIESVYNNASELDRVPLDGLKADCYLELGDVDSAQACYERVLVIHHDAPYWAHVGYANILERQGLNDKSVSQMMSGLEKEYSIELVRRVIRLSEFTSNASQTHQEIADIVLSLGSNTVVADAAELFIVEGISEEGSRLFDSLLSGSADDLPLVERIAKTYMSIGESRLAVQKVAAWKASNINDNRLDSLYEQCRELQILSSWGGAPCVLLEHGRQLHEFELRANGYRVRNGVLRYSRLISEEDSVLENAEQYLLHIPECLLDIKNDSYTIEITDLTNGMRKYTASYLKSKLIVNDSELWQGDFEYLGDNRIHGWYFSHTDKVDRLALYINGEFVKELTAHTERPDVAGMYGQKYLQTGFDCTWRKDLRVDKVELRNTVTGLPVLSTPIKVQRLEDAVQELESSLSSAREPKNSMISSAAIDSVFESLREMPDVAIDFTTDSSMLSNNYEDGVSVIIPVYNGLDDVKQCIASLLASGDTGPHEILCVNDCSPDANVKIFLDDLEQENPSVTVVHSEVNRGFVKTVNKGLMARTYKNTVILNSDTIVPAKFIDRLSSAYELNNKFGVITPLSNNATIFSFPLTLQDNLLSDAGEFSRIDSLLQENASDELYEMPTGHGYCMFVSGDVLESVGALNEEEWGVGYGEENDFCQQVKMHGWKVGAYYGMYVGHVGSVSFGDEKREIQISKNLKRLNEIYPEYDRLIQQHIECEEDSRLARNRLQIINYCRDQQNNELGNKDILFVSHSLGGGTSEYIRRCSENLDRENIRSIILTTDKDNIVLRDLQNTLHCVFRLDETAELREQLQLMKLGDVILNSTFNFPSDLIENILDIAGQYSVVIHDYSWVCPRINLIDATGAFCGMPSSEVCVKCVEVSGAHPAFNHQWKSVSTGLDMWLTKNKALLEGARRIIAPSKDAAIRIAQKFDSLSPVVKYHSDEFEVPADTSRFIGNSIEEQVIGIFGMIGDHKGMELFKQLGWLLSSRHPGVKIVFFGAMSESDWMDGYNNIKCVGEYDQETLPLLIKREKPTVSLFLSMWPETYCYALTDAIRHGVYPVAFDIGAFAERIQMHNFGSTIPFQRNSESVCESIVQVLSSAQYKSAKLEDIRNGSAYSNYGSDYFDLDQSDYKTEAQSDGSLAV